MWRLLRKSNDIGQNHKTKGKWHIVRTNTSWWSQIDWATWANVVFLHFQCATKTKAQLPCLFTQHFTPIKRCLWSVHDTHSTCVRTRPSTVAIIVKVSSLSHLNKWTKICIIMQPQRLIISTYLVINAILFHSVSVFLFNLVTLCVSEQHHIHHQSLGMTNDKFMFIMKMAMHMV